MNVPDEGRGILTDNLGLRTRISVLWIFFAVAMAAHYALYAFEPGALEDVMSGEMALQPELAMAETLMNCLSASLLSAVFILGSIFRVINSGIMIDIDKLRFCQWILLTR